MALKSPLVGSTRQQPDRHNGRRNVCRTDDRRLQARGEYPRLHALFQRPRDRHRARLRRAPSHGKRPSKRSRCACTRVSSMPRYAAARYFGCGFQRWRARKGSACRGLPFYVAGASAGGLVHSTKALVAERRVVFHQPHANRDGIHRRHANRDGIYQRRGAFRDLRAAHEQIRRVWTARQQRRRP